MKYPTYEELINQARAVRLRNIRNKKHKYKRIQRINIARVDVAGESEKWVWFYNADDDLLWIRNKSDDKIYQFMIARWFELPAIIEYAIHNNELIENKEWMKKWVYDNEVVSAIGEIDIWLKILKKRDYKKWKEIQKFLKGK